MIPPTYLDELSLLQDQITPFSTEVAFNMIEDELGLPIDELFSEISPEPVAAASLGQVLEKHVLDGLKLILPLFFCFHPMYESISYYVDPNLVHVSGISS